MRDVGTLLRDADASATDRGLSDFEVQRMRRAMLTAIDARQTASVWWPQPMVVAATVAATLTAGVIVGRRLPSPGELGNRARLQPGVDALARDARAGGGHRQLQFATPGGTRVIWEFNPDFEP